MFSGFLRLLNRLPRPYNWIVALAILVAVIVGCVFLFGQIRGCQYKKERADYQKKEDAWNLERTRLIATAEAKEKRIAELEPKVLFYEAAAEAGRKVNDDLAKKIEDVSKQAGDEESRALVPTDCNVRARRVCDLLRANNIPHDCAAITIESCRGH